MNERLLNLADQICDQLSELERIIQRSQEGWRRYRELSDDLYLDSVALNLHSFYGGLERLFELVATAIDGSLPQGVNWHRMLLEQMAVEVTGIRPAVISRISCEALDEYRGFCHVVRHVYTFELDASRIQRLVEGSPTAFERVHSELSAFASFLKQRARFL